MKQYCYEVCLCLQILRRFVKVPERFFSVSTMTCSKDHFYEALGTGVCISLVNLFLWAQRPQIDHAR